jgi:hypothetical protein
MLYICILIPFFKSHICYALLAQYLGQNSWWGARLLISLVEFQSRNILRLCALSEIINLPFTILLVFTYVLCVIALLSYQHVIILYCYCIAIVLLWKVLRYAKPCFFTGDAPVCWLLLFIISFWSCVLHRREIRLHAMCSMSFTMDWVRYRRNQRYRISCAEWLMLCFHLLNKWHQCVNNIYDNANSFSPLSLSLFFMLFQDRSPRVLGSTQRHFHKLMLSVRNECRYQNP